MNTMLQHLSNKTGSKLSPRLGLTKKGGGGVAVKNAPLISLPYCKLFFLGPGAGGHCECRRRRRVCLFAAAAASFVRPHFMREKE